jgi:methylenetetrahydrofolate--tRNA-(uracil-5-)-methyltransferase
MYEMRPEKTTPAHTTAQLAELVCSNSLKSQELTTASGLLKAELLELDSLLIATAKKCAVPAGSALAVDRAGFSHLITQKLLEYKNFKLVTKEVTQLPASGINIIATGPLTSDAFTSSLTSSKIISGKLHFYDALAPIIDGESIDTDKAFFASRYGKGCETDYLNCGMTKEEYLSFYQALITAGRVTPKDFEVFEGCMPVEVMAARGVETLRYGPLKPVGIGHGKYHAVVQLRKENVAGSAYNMVGFQTNLKYGEQERVFRMIPGLQNAVFHRFGSMHRNTYLDTPNLKKQKDLYFAGQITGVEGYCESIMSGMFTAFEVLAGQKFVPPPVTTMCGALLRYINTPTQNFQPMGANFGLLPPLSERIRDKKERYEALAARALLFLERKSNQKEL